MARLSLSSETLVASPTSTIDKAAHKAAIEARRAAAFAAREAAEPEEKVCEDCQELKPKAAYRQLPVGGKAAVCIPCAGKRTTYKDRRKNDLETVIQEELWSQYDSAEKSADKIRCLEALVKIKYGNKGDDANSKLSDAAVVANLMKSLKAKKANARNQDT